MRSRSISSIIIIQNFAQLKALFKDTWETIPGNCDTFIYLGGNEQSTHKYVSELLGKGTIDKKSSGETKGRQGSSSRNYDVLGRELLMPDEVRKLDNKKCLLFIRGFDPIMDAKFIPFGHPMFSQTADGKGKPYVHEIGQQEAERPYDILGKKSLVYFEKLKKKGDPVYIDSLDYEEFSLLTSLDRKKQFLKQGQEKKAEEETKKNDRNIEKQKKIAVKRKKPDGEDTLTNRMAQWQYSVEQKEELHRMMEAGVPKEKILSVFYPETEAEKMREIREQFQEIQNTEK